MTTTTSTTTITHLNTKNKTNPKEKKKSKKKIPPEVFAFRREIHQCCKNNDLHTAIQAYHRIKQTSERSSNSDIIAIDAADAADAANTTISDITPIPKKRKVELESKKKEIQPLGLKSIEPQTFHNLIALCDGFSDRSIHIGTPKTKKITPVSNISKEANETNQSSSTQTPPNPNESTTKENSIHENDNTDNQTEKKITIIPVSPQQRRDFATLLQNDMSALCIPLKETSYTSLIRLYSKSLHVKEARAVLHQALSLSHSSSSSSSPSSSCSSILNPKLRMFTSLMTAYTELNDLQNVLELWKMLQQQNIRLSEKEYSMIMKCATFAQDDEVMDKALTELAEEVLVPSRSTTEIIQDWFRSKNNKRICEMKKETNDSLDLSDSLLSTVDLKSTMAPSILKSLCKKRCSTKFNSNVNNKTPYDISTECQINTKTGMLQTGCLSTAQLQPIPLCKESQSLMLTMNETIVLSGKLKDHDSPYQGGRKGKKRLPKTDMMEKRVKQWSNFKAWLFQQVGAPAISYKEDERTKVSPELLPTVSKLDESSSKNQNSLQKQQRFDVVLDGANIGYFQTNFNGAPKHVDYRQIDWVIQHFKKINKRVLLILHERHFHPNLMPTHASDIVQSWKRGSSLLSLYQAPYGSNDDWFWFHAAIWCGEGTMVVTNDEMRDHFFQMLTHGMFLRWKERHQIHFSLGDWISDEDKGIMKRKVELVFPDIYSRRIQKVCISTGTNLNKDGADDDGDSIDEYGLVIPLPKRGDLNRFLDGMHVADDTELLEETYVCIRQN